MKKSSLLPSLNKQTSGSPTETSPVIPSATTRKYQRGILILTMVPQADRILVTGDGGERVIEVTSNVMRVELHEGDTKVLAKKQKYKEASFELKSWKHGDSISQTLYLELEM